MSVVLMEGLGLGEQGHFINELGLYSVKVAKVDLEEPLSSDAKKLIEESGVVIFRSRWSATVEDRILVKILFKKYQKHLDFIGGLVEAKKIKVVGIGRGAFLWLEWLQSIKKFDRELVWAPKEFLNTWMDVKLHTKRNSLVSIRALASGRALSIRSDFGGCSVRPWVISEGDSWGWVVNEFFYLSFVDIFSLSERAQLPDYGYADLSSISTRIHIVNMISSGEM